MYNQQLLFSDEKALLKKRFLWEYICGTSGDQTPWMLVGGRLLKLPIKAPQTYLSLQGCKKFPTVGDHLVHILGCSRHDLTVDLDTDVSMNVTWPTCASSCGEPGGLNGKTLARTGDTEKVGVRCVSWSDGSAHLTWRTSSRSRPSYSGRAFHLRERERERRLSLDDGLYAWTAPNLWNQNTWTTEIWNIWIWASVLTCVCSQMGLEVGALGVGFPTARELAAVRRGAFSGPRPAASLLFHAPHVIVRVKLQQRRRRRRG